MNRNRQIGTPAVSASAAPAGAAPHHPALTGEDPLIPAGANRVKMDLVDLDEETGRTIGHLYLPGYAPGVSDSELRVHQDRGGPWVADELPGGMPDQSARDPHALMAKVARLYGITGTGTVEDERDNAKRKLSGTRPLPAAAAPAAPKVTPPAPAPETRTVWVNARGGIVRNPSQVEIVRGQVKRREIPVTPVAGTGPGNVPIGGTDADRRTARPRMEGETDRAYAIRTAPSRDAALRMLSGHQLAGLRAIAREEGVVTASGDTRTGLIERLMRALHDRHADSVAITDMVNRDRIPAASVTPAAPRTNTPATSTSITPTMTGAQLLAARRAARNA